MNLSRVLGPSLAGAIIAVLAGGDTTSQFSVGVVFALNGLLYLASVLSLLMVRHRGYSTMQAGSSIWNDVAESFRYIWGYRLLRGLIILMFVPLLFGFPIQSLMPVFNHDILNGGPEDLGLLLSAMGGGAIVGSIILARLGDTPYKGRVLYSCAFLWAVTLAGLAISRTVPSALFACALMGLVSSMFMSMHMSVVTVIIDPAMRGRVMSILMMSFGLMPLGALPVSFVAESAGIDIALLGCAFGLAALAGILLLTVRELRSINTTVREAPLEPAPGSANAG
jgi:Na+/melibiose symporter-like transporter